MQEAQERARALMWHMSEQATALSTALAAQTQQVQVQQQQVATAQTLLQETTRRKAAAIKQARAMCRVDEQTLIS